mgnify:CR=1 FL=1
MTNAVWITWDDHRRSRELSGYWGVKYRIFEYSGSALARYVFLSIRTIKYLLKSKPGLVVCQNPSVVLSALLVLVSRIQKFFLIIDRHSNFKIPLRESRHPKWRAFHYFSDYSIRNADLTIVTNSEAAEYVSALGGKPVILPDKLPSALVGGKVTLKGEVNFLLICSFGSDEPIDSILNSFIRLDQKYQVYVTGNFKKYDKWKSYSDIDNINFLGFINESDYLDYLASVDATIVLTDMPMTLNCGSYESVKVGKPQIVADSPVIKEWFSRGAVYVNPKDEDSILHGIKLTIEGLSELTAEQNKFSEVIDSKWKILDGRFREAVYHATGFEL